jgi:polar amino acid transport system substrate-binding protein
MVKRNPERYYEAGARWFTMLYAAAVRQGDPDWLNFVNMVFDVAMFGHQNELCGMGQGAVVLPPPILFGPES